MKILVISVVNSNDPAIRYRITYPINILQNKKEIKLSYLNFYSHFAQKKMGDSNILFKLLLIAYRFFIFLIKLLIINKQYDIIIIKSYIFPIGGSNIDNSIIRFFKYKKLFYDIDDGIYLNQTREQNAGIGKFRNAKQKVHHWSNIANNILICNHILEHDLKNMFNISNDKFTRLVSLPFCNQYFNNSNEVKEIKNSIDLNIVWLGSPHTQNNLILFKILFKKIFDLFPNSKIYLIGTSNDFQLFEALENIYFIPWSLENERIYMRIAHFGLNPLFDSEFERRKCAFKVFQYYRAGIIPIVSAVGINEQLVSSYFGIATNNCDKEIDTIINFMNQMIEIGLPEMGKRIFDSSHLLTAEHNSSIFEKILKSI